jgi:hypothetical protein
LGGWRALRAFRFILSGPVLKVNVGPVLWYTTVIPAMWEADIGVLQFQASPRKKKNIARLYLKNNLKQNELGCESSGRALALKPPAPQKKKKK